jgi:AraC-like DNA-binding protein
MSSKRQPAIRAFAASVADYKSPRHWHAWDQLTYSTAGAMHVRSGSEQWLVPPGRAIWIPARTRHAEQVQGAASLHTLYFAAGLVRTLPRACAIVEVSPLLRELVAHVSAIGDLDRRKITHARLIGVLIDQLVIAPGAPLQLPELRDPRARQVAEILRERPETGASVGALARAAGTSARTIERLFLVETKMTIGDWRRQLRLLHAVRLLASGSAVGASARAAGYASPSAFIAAFRKKFGKTPRRYGTN